MTVPLRPERPYTTERRSAVGVLVETLLDHRLPTCASLAALDALAVVLGSYRSELTRQHGYYLRGLRDADRDARTSYTHGRWDQADRDRE